MKKNKGIKLSFIRDAVHKNIDISSSVIKDLIATKEFQRLRRIMQLGGAQMAFPSATHTRYSHSLGVYHILNRILNETQGSEQIAEADKTIIKIAGLLHDIGHGPFSHSFEKILNFNNIEKITHEEYTCAIITNPTTEIFLVLKKYHIDINKIVALLKKDYQKCPKYQIQLVSSQLDADRIDYLMRDGYFTGVDYGSIDLEWVITNLIIDFKHGLIFSQKAVSAIENYLVTRFHMYSQVYYHKSGILFDINLQRLFIRLYELFLNKKYEFKIDISSYYPIFKVEMIEVEQYLRWTDASIIELMQAIITFEPDEQLVNIAKNILCGDDWENKIEITKDSKIENSVFKQALTNVLYDLSKEPIMIKVLENVLPLEKVSQILQNPTNVETINYFLVEG